MNWRYPIVMSLHYLRRPDRLRQLRKLREFFGLPLDEKRAIQERGLSALLRHAAEHVPYYGEILRDSGVYRGGEIDLSNFSRIPFLDKKILVDEFERLKSDDLSKRKWYLNSTGGSTGEPAIFVQDRDYLNANMAAKMLQQEWCGRREGEIFIRLWSDPKVIKKNFGYKLGAFFENEIWKGVYRLTDDRIAEYIELIARKKPKYVIAFVQSAYEIAKYANSEGIKILGTGALIPTGGVLTPEMREEIGQAFNCEIFNRYGSQECGDIALEDKSHSELVVNMRNHFVEVLDEEGRPAQAGEAGEIAVTNLINYAMPLIRYRIGDRGVPAEVYGEPVFGVSRLASIIGRTVDVFIAEDGARIDGLYFNNVLRYRRWIKRFQVVQEIRGKILLRFVQHAGRPIPEGELAEIERQVKLLMGDSCEVQFEFTDELPPSPSGKHRYFISTVDS